MPRFPKILARLKKPAIVSLAVFAVIVFFLVSGLLSLVPASSTQAQVFRGPSTSAGVGAGAINIDASRNIAIGTSTPQSDTKLLIIGTSTSAGAGSSYFAIKVLNVNRGPLFIVRGDGSVTIGSPIIQTDQSSATTTISGLGAAPANGALFVNGPIFTTLDIKANGLAIGTTTPQSGGNVYVSGNVTAGGSIIGSNYAATVGANNVTAGVFATGNFAFSASSSLGIATSTQAGLPQTLSIYGGGYFSGNVGIGTVSPGSSALKVNGNIESIVGGLKFPDGTIQSVAVAGSSGTIKFAINFSIPTTCNATSDAALALTSYYTTCACKNGTGWVSTNDGSTSCAWGALTNGACGSAAGSGVTSTPSTNLCSVGSASAVAGSGPYTWTCAGLNGGSTASCSTLTPVEDVFSTYTYTGDGSAQTITNGIDITTIGGMVWIKNRGVGVDNLLFDTVRGVTKGLSSNLTGAQVTSAGYLDAFNTNGFGVNTATQVNMNGQPIVSWTFRKAPKFFTHQSLSHTSGVADTIDLSTLGTVGMVAIKRTDSVSNWTVFHRSATTGKLLYLNTTAAETTDTTLTLSGTTLTVEQAIATGTYIIYAWAHDTSANGLIQCGSFTTDGSNSASVTLGWEPQFLLFKGLAVYNWVTYDTARSFSRTNSAFLYPNLSNAEDPGGDRGRPNATGFDIVNIGTGTYVYCAIRKAPMKTPTAGTQVYNAINRTSNLTQTNITGVGFSPDLLIVKGRGASAEGGFWDRLRGNLQFLYPERATLEYTTATDALMSFNMDGVTVGADAFNWVINNGTMQRINYFFRRAPGFFDEVAYMSTDGTGATTIAHNLGVTPELIIIKSRTGLFGWAVRAPILGSNDLLFLNMANSATNPAGYWSGAATATVFPVGTNNAVNRQDSFQEKYVAYLFATLPGISKVGSYTSTGVAQTINAGFSTSARFVLIKRTDAAGDWYVYDSVRGIVTSGNDPYLLLNSTAAEVTTTNYIDPNSAGFYLNASTPINTSGGTYVYFAVN